MTSKEKVAYGICDALDEDLADLTWSEDCAILVEPILNDIHAFVHEIVDRQLLCENVEVRQGFDLQAISIGIGAKGKFCILGRRIVFVDQSPIFAPLCHLAWT